MSVGSITSANELTETSLRCQSLVIGSGAGGSVAAALLAESGRDVIVLEEGPHYDTGRFTPSVSEMTEKLYRNGGVFPFVGMPTMAFGEGCCVGGGTVINGGLLWRTPPWVLQEWERDHGLQGYGEEVLTPHFETIERDLNVVRHTLETEENLESVQLHNAAESLGWKSVMVPRAIKNCINENLCPTGCMAGAKQSMLQTYLPRAVAAGARVFADSRVQRIEHSQGRASRVHAVSTGDSRRKLTVEFDEVYVAGGAVQTPHLLRRSGLSKRAGQSLRFHYNLKMIALFKEPVYAERGTIFTTQIQEFEQDGIIICASNLRPHYLAMTASHFGDDVINHLLDRYAHAGIFVAMTRPQSRAHVVSALGEDPFVWYGFDKGDMGDIRLALEKTAQALFESGVEELYFPVVGSEVVRSPSEVGTLLETVKPGSLELMTVHTMASCPMGSNPNTSVVDMDGRVRGTDNVFVTDASVLPTNVGESPQGTLMAFTHEIMRRRLGG